VNIRLPAVAAAAVLLVAIPINAQAKSVGGCPTEGGFRLVTVASLGIPPDAVSGIASLDGNEDGLTCIKPIKDDTSLIFRDNTVAR
jgi:hypothetical protein